MTLLLERVERTSAPPELPRKAPRRKRKLHLPGSDPMSLVVVAGLGFFIAFFYLISARSLFVDSDGATALLEGQSMAAGHLTLHGWSLSVDSFWTVDAFANMVVGLALGFHSTLLHLVPALIAALTLLVGALVACWGRRGAGAVAAVVTTLVLLGFPSPLMADFFLRGPYHVGTTLWCLTAFYFLRRGRFDRGWLIAVALLAAASTGDLQALGIGVVPVLLAGAVAAIRAHDWSEGAPLVAASAAGGVLALVVRLFAELVGTFTIGGIQPSASPGEKWSNAVRLPASFSHLLGFGGREGAVPAALEVFRLSAVLLVAATVGLAAVGIVGGCRGGLDGPSGPQQARESRE